MPVSAVVSAWAFCQRFKFFSLLPALGVCWLWGFLEGQRPKYSKYFPGLPKRGSLQGLLEKGLQSFGPARKGRVLVDVLGLQLQTPCGLCIRRGSNKGHHSFIHSFLLLSPHVLGQLAKALTPKPSWSSVCACVWQLELS